MSDQTHIWPQNMGCKSSRKLSKYPKFPKIFTRTHTGWVQLVEYKYEFRTVFSVIIALWLSIIFLPYYWLELETWWLMSCIAYVRFSHSHPQSNFRFPIFASYHHHLPICLQTTVYPWFKPFSSTLVPLQCCWLWCHACSYGLCCQEPDLSGHVRWTFRCVPVGSLGFPVVPVRNSVVGLKAEDARPRPKDVPSEWRHRVPFPLVPDFHMSTFIG